MLVSRDFRHSGGVVNYIRILKKNLSKKKQLVKHFVQGLKPAYQINLFLPLVYLYQLSKFKKALNEFKPDIVHLNSSLIWGSIIRDFLFLKVAKENGYPVLFFIHGWQEKISNMFEKNGFWIKYFKKRFKKADGIVVLANQFKEKLVNLGIDQKKIYISSTMVDSNKYYPNNKEFIKPFRILFCANLRKEKGPYELLDAVPLVLSKYEGTKFTFIGKGEHLDNLKENAKEKGLEKNVEFTGYISLEEKIKRFKEAHIFAFPTYHGEGFPTVILEAMAAGMPVVTTTIAGLVNAIENGREGYIIKTMPSDPEEIAKKIIQLIENPELMKKMSENNLTEAKEEYDEKVVSKQIIEMYHDILKRKH